MSIKSHLLNLPKHFYRPHPIYKSVKSFKACKHINPAHLHKFRNNTLNGSFGLFCTLVGGAIILDEIYDKKSGDISIMSSTNQIKKVDLDSCSRFIDMHTSIIDAISDASIPGVKIIDKDEFISSRDMAIMSGEHLVIPAHLGIPKVDVTFHGDFLSVSYEYYGAVNLYLNNETKIKFQEAIREHVHKKYPNVTDIALQINIFTVRVNMIIKCGDTIYCWA